MYLILIKKQKNSKKLESKNRYKFENQQRKLENRYVPGYERNKRIIKNGENLQAQLYCKKLL